MKQQLCEDLKKLASHWLDPAYPLRQQALRLAAPEFCLSATSFELALDCIFSEWTETKILAAIEGNPFKASCYAAQILAGTTPAMIAQGFFQGAILNIPQCIKIPRQQAIFARLLHQSFVETAFYFSQLFELHTEQDFYSQLAQADLVFAYGRDETMAVLKQHLAPGVTFIAHGHAESAALIFKEATTLPHLEQLAYDFLSYDQRGCLSPRVTYIEEGGALSPADCARLFAEEVLPAVAKQLPRGGLFPGEAAEILHQRCLYGFRGKVYCGEDWTVCYEQENSWPREALPRFISFKPFASTAECLEVLEPKKKHLISVGYAGPEAKIEQLNKTLKVRLCGLGEMQKQLLVF